ncbi:MAG TPA: 6-hydroxymethylpterin diphosphokinase MptE-like protein [Nitrososphaerales archaeon]|nr:6-hydroxymethylpterin diphosphokinase MptE-like protein [Nitrososphaerales archaeon]
MRDAEFLFPLGKEWYEKFYVRIRDSLNLSERADTRSRDLLSRLLTEKGSNTEYGKIALLKEQSRKKRKRTVVFGAGPSLEEDLAGLCEFVKHESNNLFVVAADGAADGLISEGIEPQILVSDLDSCSERVLIDQSTKKEDYCLLVHAHGDNMSLISRIAPLLGRGNVLGTTQVLPLENVQNVGGFTDGDRACYLAAAFLHPEQIIIAGMDFGRVEGRFSRARSGASGISEDWKFRKLEFGRESLEYLITRCHGEIDFVNVTSKGTEINGARHSSYSEIISEYS